MKFELCTYSRTWPKVKSSGSSSSLLVLVTFGPRGKTILADGDLWYVSRVTRVQAGSSLGLVPRLRRAWTSSGGRVGWAGGKVGSLRSFPRSFPPEVKVKLASQWVGTRARSSLKVKAGGTIVILLAVAMRMKRKRS